MGLMMGEQWSRIASNLAVIANLNYPITVILGKKPRSDCLVSLTAKDQIFLKEYVMNMIPDIKIFYYDR